MFVTEVSLRRDGYFGGAYGKADPTKPFRAQVGVQGTHGKVELELSPELSARIVDVIADEIAAAGRATAEALTAACLTATAATPALEADNGNAN
jgi:hypothetical protein